MTARGVLSQNVPVSVVTRGIAEMLSPSRSKLTTGHRGSDDLDDATSASGSTSYSAVGSMKVSIPGSASNSISREGCSVGAGT